MLNSKIVKIGAASLIVVGVSAALAGGAYAERKHGGKGMIKRICAPDAAQKHAERSARVQNVLKLSADQQVLYAAFDAQRQATAAKFKPFCDQIVEGERPSKELRRAMKRVGMEAKLDGLDTREAFMDSLSKEQKRALKKEMRKMRKEARKARHGDKYDSE